MMSKIISTVKKSYRQGPHLYSEETVLNLLHSWSRKHMAETNVQTAYTSCKNLVQKHRVHPVQIGWWYVKKKYEIVIRIILKN